MSELGLILGQVELRKRLAIVEAERDALTARLEAAEAALVRIDEWSRAYPERVFPEPDLKKAAETLKAAGITSDALHGSWARHLMKGVGEIARAALTPPATETK